MTQLGKLREFMANREYTAALRLAARWADLGPHKAEITRGWSALRNPRFYREIGQDPKNLIRCGLLAICERYKLEGIDEVHVPDPVE